MAEFPGDSAARRAGGRGRHVPGSGGNVAAQRDRQLQVDCDRAGAGNNYRRAAGAGGDDRGAAADGFEPRLWCVVRDTGGDGGILYTSAECAGVHDGGAFAGSDFGSVDVYGKLDGRGETPRGAAAKADYLQGAEFCESGIAGGGAGDRRDAGDAPGEDVSFSGDDRDSAFVRGDDDYSDRRSGHADGDVAAEFVCGIIGSGDGVRAGKQAVDYCGSTGWRIRV